MKGTPLEKYIGAGQAKNLFFRVPSSGGKLKNRLFLVCALVETNVDNKALSARLGIKPSAPLRLAPDDIFDSLLQIPKGSVNPFVMAQATCNEITLILDKKFKTCERLLFHPMQNDYTTSFAPDQLDVFLEKAAPSRYVYVDLASSEPIELASESAAAPPGAKAPASSVPKAVETKAVAGPTAAATTVKSGPSCRDGKGLEAAAADASSWPAASLGHELHWHFKADRLIRSLRAF